MVAACVFLGFLGNAPVLLNGERVWEPAKGWRVMTIGVTITWRGRQYTVMGYVTQGGKVIALWLDGVEAVLKGKQLGEIAK